MSELFDVSLARGLWLPLSIFVAELSVVTLDTIRTIFISRGLKVPAALLGLVLVSIWLFAIGQIMQNLGDVFCFVAYAAGYTAGNFLGITIEGKLALGSLVVRTITKKDAGPLIDVLRKAGYGVTSIDATGAFGPVHVLFTIIRRRKLNDVLQVINEFDPKTFYTIEDVRRVTGSSAMARQPAMIPSLLSGPVTGASAKAPRSARAA